MITAIPVHNISNVCYAKEAENSHVIAIQNGKKRSKLNKKLMRNFFIGN